MVVVVVGGGGGRGLGNNVTVRYNVTGGLSITRPIMKSIKTTCNQGVHILHY